MNPYNLIPPGNYLPTTSSSLSEIDMSLILNDIVLNQRLKILEFGAGISTILTGLLLKERNNGARLVSIEHDAKFAEIMTNYIQKFRIDDFVEIIVVDLLETQEILNSSFYSEKALNTIIENKLAGKIDALIVDGPPAYRESICNSRRTSMAVFNRYRSENSSLFLHDINRKQEKVIFSDWCGYLKQEGTNFSAMVNANFGIIFFGEYYNIV
jgi:hypothetical protein